jgi:hypothetical protein
VAKIEMEVKGAKLSASSKKDILKLSAFIAKLKPTKLNMGIVAELRGSEKMDPIKCNSAGCAMGWSPIVFPNKLVYEDNDEDTLTIATKDLKHDGVEAMVYVLKIPDFDADILFGAGSKTYRSPEQVAKGLKEYANTGVVPRACFEDSYDYFEYISNRLLAD